MSIDAGEKVNVGHIFYVLSQINHERSGLINTDEATPATSCYTSMKTHTSTIQMINGMINLKVLSTFMEPIIANVIKI